MSELGLKPHQIGILQLLAANGHMPQTQLGKILGVDKAAMVHSLNDLEAIKAVRRQPHPDDGRAFVVHLLPDGSRLLRSAELKNQDVSDEVFGSLSESERKLLHDLLLRIREDLQVRERSSSPRST